VGYSFVLSVYSSIQLHSSKCVSDKLTYLLIYSLSRIFVSSFYASYFVHVQLYPIIGFLLCFLDGFCVKLPGLFRNNNAHHAQCRHRSSGRAVDITAGYDSGRKMDQFAVKLAIIGHL